MQAQNCIIIGSGEWGLVVQIVDPLYQFNHNGNGNEAISTTSEAMYLLASPKPVLSWAWAAQMSLRYTNTLFAYLVR